MLDFLEQIKVVQLFELYAALTGSFYLYKTHDRSFVRYFVWFLWVTFFVEILAHYTAIAYYSNYEKFSFIKDTPFDRNYWLYNIYSILAFSVYINFFRVLLKSNKWRKAILVSLIFFVLAAIVNLLVTDVYFKAHSIFTFFVGTIMVVASIGVYYLQLLRSNEILEIKFSVPFYISIGALIYHLCFVPLVIYNRYFNQSSPEFVVIYTNVLIGINYFLYSIYIIGFLICSRRKNFYSSATS